MEGFELTFYEARVSITVHYISRQSTLMFGSGCVVHPAYRTMHAEPHMISGQSTLMFGSGCVVHPAYRTMHAEPHITAKPPQRKKLQVRRFFS